MDHSKLKIVSYSNCQGAGVLHFLRKSVLGSQYDMVHYNNYQLTLDEADPNLMLADARQADVFLFQNTKAFVSRNGVEVPSTDEILKTLKPDCRTISFAYQFNHDFFPIVKHGEWVTGEQVRLQAKKGAFYGLLATYNADQLNFDCAKRFIECLAEQSRREQQCKLKIAPFILQSYRHSRLFLTENHPTSALFAYIASRVLQVVGLYEDEDVLAMRTTNENEVGLPMGINPTHPAVVRELGLEYGPDERAHEFYRERLEQFMKETTAADCFPA